MSTFVSTSRPKREELLIMQGIHRGRPVTLSNQGRSHRAAAHQDGERVSVTAFRSVKNWGFLSDDEQALSPSGLALLTAWNMADSTPVDPAEPYRPYARVIDLSPDQLNVHLGRWFGLAPNDDAEWPSLPTWSKGQRNTDEYCSIWPGPPAYASDLKYAAKAEERLIGEGHAERYGQTLYLLMHDLPGPFDEYDYRGGATLAALATASAELRCRAVLEVLAQVGKVQL